MSSIADIVRSKAKSKERMTQLAEAIQKDKKSRSQLLDFFPSATTPEKGICLEAIELMTRTEPQLGEPFLDLALGSIGDKAPGIKRESSRIVANLAKEFPDQTAKAIPKLLNNRADDGTVVRWSAALALTEIAKANPKTRKQLLPIFSETCERENNNGVKSIYVKALKFLEKNKP